MVSGQIQDHVQVGHDHAVASLHGEVHLRTHGAHIHRTHLRFFVEAVAGDGAREVEGHFAHGCIVGAQNGGAVKRHAVQEINKRFLEFVEVVPVGLHVVRIDVGDHRHDGQQIQERGIGLVSLDHDVVTTAQARIRASAVEAPANHKGGVQSGLAQHAGHQAGGGGFAVRARNGNATLETHELSQHECARHDGDVFGACCHHFGVVGLHRSGRDHRISTCDVVGGVANVGAHAQRCQALQGRAVCQVRTRDDVAQVVQHFGNAGHARTTQAYKVNVTDGVFHADKASQLATTSRTACVLARVCAFCAHCSRVVRCTFCSMSANFSAVKSAC